MSQVRAVEIVRDEGALVPASLDRFLDQFTVSEKLTVLIPVAPAEIVMVPGVDPVV